MSDSYHSFCVTQSEGLKIADRWQYPCRRTFQFREPSVMAKQDRFKSEGRQRYYRAESWRVASVVIPTVPQIVFVSLTLVRKKVRLGDASLSPETSSQYAGDRELPYLEATEAQVPGHRISSLQLLNSFWGRSVRVIRFSLVEDRRQTTSVLLEYAWVPYVQLPGAPLAFAFYLLRFTQQIS